MYNKYLIIAFALVQLKAFSHTTFFSHNSSQNQIKESLLKDRLQQGERLQANQSIDQIFNIEEQFDSTNAPGALLIKPSDIEDYYRIKLSSIRNDINELNKIESLIDSINNIKYFGYDYFYNFEQRQFLERSIPSNQYILGPGDEIIISIWGQTERRDKKIIGRDGSVFLNDIGQVNLAGKSLTQAQEYLEIMLSKVYETITGDNPQTYVDISHGKISGKMVAFTGFVNLPGLHVVNPYVDPISALIYAGGVDTTGSLRNIIYYRNEAPIDTLDLYDYLINGFSLSKIFIRDGDRIHVPKRANKITISGEVYRPAHFEMKNNETLLEAINFAGGAKFEKISIIHLRRIINNDSNNSLYLKWEDLSNINIENGDSLSITTYRQSLDYIYIYGFINKPIKFPYQKNISLESLIKTLDINNSFSNSLKWSSSINHKSLGKTNKIFFDSLFKDDSLITLLPNDQITFSKNPNYIMPGTVKLSGAVNNSGILPVSPHGESLKSLIILAGGKKSNALNEGIQIYRDSLRLGWQNESMLILPGDSIVILYDQGTIEILGQVNAPGIYEIGNKSLSVRKALAMAGGVNNLGSKKNMYVIYSNGMVQTASRRFFNVSLKSGSTLVIGAKSANEYRTTLETTEKLAGIIGSLATLMLVINSTTSSN